MMPLPIGRGIQTVDKVPDDSPGFSYVLVIHNSFLEN